MSDSKKIPGAPPPDDFSKTTPNVNVPRGDDEPAADWDKTNYRFPKQPSPDDWGKTVANIKPIDTGGSGSGGQDFDKTFYPGAQKPSTPDWGMTEARIDMSQVDRRSEPEEFERPAAERYDKTTPYFRLPEAEREKYQNLPPTPAEQAAQEEQKRKAKGGVPLWIWGCGGLSVLFVFVLAGFGVAYYVITRNTGYKATVANAPPGSTITVDGRPWGVSNDKGEIELPLLREGEVKRIEIVHPTWTCQPAQVRGQNGVANPNPIIAQCAPVPVKAGEDCTNIQLGEFDKAERCYHKALDDLPTPFTPEDLVRALNILIINFDVGSYAVPPVRRSALKRAAEYIQKLEPGVVLEVGGHTDSQGQPASNQVLSENRANAVKEVLVTFGARADSLQTRGYGATQPKTDNSTELNRFYNRRIQYSVVRK